MGLVYIRSGPIKDHHRLPSIPHKPPIPLPSLTQLSITGEYALFNMGFDLDIKPVEYCSNRYNYIPKNGFPYLGEALISKSSELEDSNCFQCA